MTLDQALNELENLGDAKVAAQYAKRGAGEKSFGVRLGDVRKVARRVRRDHSLGLALWNTAVLEARLLAILVMDLKKLDTDELERLVQSVSSTQVHDWMISYIVSKHADRETLRVRWMTSDDRMLARAGWSLTADRAGSDPDGLDGPALLDRIRRELADADPSVQWTMNHTLAAIGIHAEHLRDRAIAIGEELGVYRDYPVPKGCTSPFAPIWINEMVRRQV